MKFSTKTLYGLKAVLILAGRFGEGSMSVSQIAKKEGISLAYLEQILNSLKKKGLVKSVRGPQGGYVLSKKPSEVTLEELFYLLDHATALGPEPVPDPEKDEACIANLIFWNRFRQSIAKGLGATSLKDLLEEARQLKKSRQKTTHTFHI